jgi:hypothetical protein
MSNIVTFSEGAVLPAYARNRDALAANAKRLNADVGAGATFATLSIKGKVFTLTRGEERQTLTVTVDGEEMPRSSINMTVVRANKNARVFYGKTYSEDDDNGPPPCSSYDGIKPRAGSPDPQAKTCATCPHAVWGSKLRDDGEAGKGTACTVNTRLALIDPNKPDEPPILLRVPAGSRKEFTAAVKFLDQRGLPYNAGVLKVSFDVEAASPKLLFKPIGLVSDDVKAKVDKLYDDEITKAIVGVTESEPETPAVSEVPELDAAIAAKAAMAKASSVSEDEVAAAVAGAAPPKPVAKSTRKPAPAKVTEAEVADAIVATKEPAVPAKAATVSDMDALLGDLDALLSNKDD